MVAIPGALCSSKRRVCSNGACVGAAQILSLARGLGDRVVVFSKRIRTLDYLAALLSSHNANPSTVRLLVMRRGLPSIRLLLGARAPVRDREREKRVFLFVDFGR